LENGGRGLMYSSLFKNIFMPIFEKGIKRRKILEYRARLEKSQWLSKEKLKDLQLQELKKLIDHAATHVPYWKETFHKLGINAKNIRTIEDFRKLPLTTKDDIRAHKKDMIAENYRGKTWTKSTGGSTGVPLELEYTPESYDWRLAETKRGYSWAGCEDGIKQAYIWGTDIKEPSRFTKIKRKLHYSILRHRYYNCFTFTQDIMEETFKDLNRFQPEIIIGYTNPLYNFAQFIINKKLAFHPKAVITGAEKLHEFQRKTIIKAFGCPVFNTYGSREFMLIGAECEKHHGLHISMENLFVEIIKEDGTPAKEGEMGEIVITDLHNYGMPFLRYKIGDLGIVSETPCPCGRGLILLKDVIGRSLDMLKTPDGRFVPGEFFPHLMKEFKGVKQFQIIQDHIGELTIKIVKSADLKNSDFQFMNDKIQGIMGQSIKVNYEFVSDIALTKTGKHRVTISNLQSTLT
jgi:phenylacetate-CoA ligase